MTNYQLLMTQAKRAGKESRWRMTKHAKLTRSSRLREDQVVDQKQTVE